MGEIVKGAPPLIRSSPFASEGNLLEPPALLVAWPGIIPRSNCCWSVDVSLIGADVAAAAAAAVTGGEMDSSFVLEVVVVGVLLLLLLLFCPLLVGLAEPLRPAWPLV